MEELDNDEIIKDMELDKLRDKKIIIAEKMCNHCNKEFNLRYENVWDDGWIKDVTCPHCKKVVHIWFKFHLE